MPSFENEPLQPSSLLAELFGTDLPGATILPACADSSAFDALRRLCEDPATFIANPMADELLSAISMLSPQENDSPLASGSAMTDALQVFNFDEYLQDFWRLRTASATCLRRARAAGHAQCDRDSDRPA
ncbi:hypothetical protein EDB83DRAFT_2525426 [Lactarius deliciosus]|nr:hypothetical protein EDB83DRAFT_2525426 [Lactarius deliciosus]